MLRHPLQKLAADLEQLCWPLVPQAAVARYRQLEPEITAAWEKAGYSGALTELGEWLNLYKGDYPGGIPNAPGPLASMLTGGLAGAGLGYGLGALGEAVLPGDWKRRRLRRTMAILGGAAGVAPGAMMAGLNVAGGKPALSSELFQQAGYVPPPAEKLPPIQPDWFSQSIKASADMGLTGIMGDEPIPVDAFNRVIWQDPRIAGPLSPQLQAAASGLVTGAANLPGKTNAEWVTPWDVARMAAGMGAGYVSGALVGKALGLLMGMPRQTQDRLKNTGMYAGLLQSIIPLAFGR